MYTLSTAKLFHRNMKCEKILLKVPPLYSNGISFVDCQLFLWTIVKNLETDSIN